MQIWIDADACPRPVKEIVFRASRRLAIPVVLVADRPVRTPASKLVTSVVVERGEDNADTWIVESLQAGDLVITADVPLAARAVERGATCINPRGELYTEENVRSSLSVRDFMAELRDSGIETGGPPPFGPKDVQRMANALDRILAQRRP